MKNKLHNSQLNLTGKLLAGKRSVTIAIDTLSSFSKCNYKTPMLWLLAAFIYMLPQLVKAQYCVPDIDVCIGAANVTFNEINNSSDCDLYGDFTHLSTTVIQGATYPIVVNTHSDSDFELINVYIDWNQNGSLDDPGERYSLSLNSHPDFFFYGNISVPESAVLGSTRMRVMTSYDSQPVNSCQLNIFGGAFFGEVEDYTIVVVSCIAPTTLVTANVTTESVDLSWDAGDAETQWELVYGAPGFDPDTQGTTETVNNDPVLTLSGLALETAYEVYVRAVCDVDVESGWAGPLSFTTLSDLICTAENWTAHPATEDNNWQSVTYGNGKFVAVSQNGTNRVMSSADGKNWTAHAAVENNQWQSVTYGNGKFVAVSQNGTNRVMSSADGVNWTAHPATENNWWQSVTYGNGKFVAVAESGTNRVMSSPDGENWTPHPAAENNQWRSVTYGNGKFVAVADFGTNRVMSSADGENWTAHPAAESNDWYSVAYGNGKFVAVAGGGTNRVMSSSDGENWTAHPAAENNWWRFVTYGNGKFVGLALTGANRVMSSADGVNWTAHPAAENNWWESVTYGDGKFVAVAGDGTNRVMVSECLSACPAPENFLLANVTTESVDLSWTPGDAETEWEVVYGAPGFDPDTQGTTETVNDDPEFTLSGLALETAYEVYVRAVCDVDEESGWAGPLSFTTLSDLICTTDNWTAHPAAEDNIWLSVTYGNGKFVAVAYDGTNRVMSSTDGENWTAYPAAENNNWRSVTYGNGKFVAVAQSGTNRVMNSTDGENWTVHAATENSQWQSVTYGNGKFVAVSINGTNRVMSSTDGENWTAHPDAEDNGWYSVTYGNGKFVAVAQSGTNRVMSSTDGENWTPHPAAEDNAWYSVTYGNGIFVAVAINGTNRVMSSTDGENWTAHPATENNLWTSVTYGNGTFVAVAFDGTNRVMSSTDGENWTPHPAAQSIEWYSVTYGNGKFVAVAGSGTNRVMISECLSSCPDPENFLLANVTTESVDLSWTPGDAETEWEVIYGTPGFDPDTQGTTETVNDDPEFTLSGLALETAYEVYVRAVCGVDDESDWTGPLSFTTLSDLVCTAENWTAHAAAENNSWRSVTYGNGKFVAVSNDGTNRVMSSTDGDNWTAHPAAENNFWHSVTYWNGKFVAVALDGTDRVMSSTDGINWTAHAAAENNSWYSVTYGNGRFVAVSNDGTNRVMSSPDGVNWTAHPAAENNTWRSVTYGNGRFVAVASSGTNRVMSSPDGVNWTAHPAPESNPWASITYGNGKFVAVSVDGTNRVMSSTDGVNWTAHPATESNSWISVTYGNGKFVAVAASGTNRVMSSPDGENWTPHPAAESSGWYSVAYGNGKFMAVAYFGTNRVMVSECLSPCPAPENFLLANVTTESVDLSWDAGDAETEWEVIYGAPGFDPDTEGTTETVNDDPEFTLSGLALETAYEVYVRAVCDDDVESDWTGPLSFTTLSDLFCTADNWTAHLALEDNGWLSVTYGNGKFVAVAWDGTNRVMSSTDGKNWTAHPAAENNFWQSVAYGNGKFVAVASGGTNRVMSSTDGENWTAHPAPGNNSWASVAYGNGKFVAVASGGTNSVMSSADGENWTPHPAAENNGWQSVTYGNGKFVAVASGGTNSVMSSPNGENWTAHAAAENNQWRSVTYGNGKFVAVAWNGSNRVMSSNDGENWTAHPAAENSSWFSVAYGNGKFVAVATSGTNRVMSSTDGVNWITHAAGANNVWRSITYGNNKFIAVAFDYINLVMVSECQSPQCIAPVNPVLANVTTESVDLSWEAGDAETQWEVVYGAPGFDPDTQGTNGIVNNDPEFTLSGLALETAYEVYVRAVCDEDTESDWTGPLSFTTLSDLICTTENWTVHAAAENNQWRSVSYGNGKFVAVASSGTNRVMSSADGENWTAHPAAENNFWQSVTYGNGKFVAVSETGTNRVMSSTDGENWTAHPAPGNNNWHSVTYGNGKFLAVASSGTTRVMTSTDGENWTAHLAPGNNQWNSVTYANGKFVAVSSNGTNRVMSSTDGEYWSSHSTVESSWRSVTYGNGKFVAVADSGTNRVMSSTDGENWTAHHAPGNTQWRSVTYGNGKFVAVANGSFSGNRVMSSADAENWTAHLAPEDNGWHSVTYGNGKFVAVAYTGINLVMVSECGSPCVAPENFLLANVTTESVDLSWEAGDAETEWEVVYGAPGFDPDSEGTIEVVNDDPEHILAGLNADTAYEVYVRAVCDVDVESDWVGPLAFTTLKECPTGQNFIFNTQAQVDQFGLDYAHCTNIELGDVTIQGADITNLNGLSGVTSISGALNILFNNNLTNLNGLSELTTIGGILNIQTNGSLANLNGLSGLTSTGGLILFNNAALSNLDGLSGLTSIVGYVQIEFNESLTNLDGLSGVTSIGGYFMILSNSQLTNISGIGNIDSATISAPGLFIQNNPLLAVCNLPNLCTYLADPDNPRTISGNAAECLNEVTVLVACGAEFPYNETQNIYTSTIQGAIEASDCGVESTIIIPSGDYSSQTVNSANPCWAIYYSVGASPGCASIGAMTLDNTDTIEIEIEGLTACTEYDQYEIINALTLGNANLEVLFTNGYEPEFGDEWMIFSNTFPGPVNGTFAGLAEGDTFTVADYELEITYVGGDGNDIVLTVAGCPEITTTDVATNQEEDIVTDCSYEFTWTEPTFTGGCDVTVTRTLDPVATVSAPYAAGQVVTATLGLGTTTVTYTATDDSGNEEIFEFTLTATDATAPVITLPVLSNPYDTDLGVCTRTLSLPATATDNCDANPTITYFEDALFTSPLVFPYAFPGGDTTVYVRVEDAQGNVSTDAFTVTVQDVILPTVMIQNITVSLDSNGTVTVDPSEVDNGSFDNCTITTMYLDTDTFTCADLGENMVVLYVEDAAGNLEGALAYITVVDDLPPVISCPADVIALAEPGMCTAEVTFANPSFIDNCSTEVTITQTAGPSSGSAFPVGVTTVTFDVTDGSGNTSSCSFTVTVEDNQIPVAVCQNITIQLDADGLATISAEDLDGGSTDNCGAGLLTFTASQTSFDCSDIGDNTITLTVTDASGNSSTCTAIVTVEDIIAPEVVCATPLTIELDADGNASITVADIDAGSSDNCSIDSITLSQSEFTCADLGDNEITLTVTDVNGNSTSCTTTVTVIDIMAPVVSCIDFTLELGPDGTALLTPEDIGGTSTDNCGIMITAIDIDEFDCSDIGTPVMVTYFASDASGNIATCTAMVTIVDAMAPVITCPDDLSVQPESTGIYVLENFLEDEAVTAIDNCSEEVTLTQLPAPGTPLGVGTYDITITAADAFGNISECVFELVVEPLTGAEDNTLLASLVMYPNPAEFTVTISNPNGIAIKEVSVYDLHGREVNKLRPQDPSADVRLNVEALPSAVYMIRIVGENGKETFRRLIRK